MSQILVRQQKEGRNQIWERVEREAKIGERSYERRTEGDLVGEDK